MRLVSFFFSFGGVGYLPEGRKVGRQDGVSISGPKVRRTTATRFLSEIVKTIGNQKQK
jgi:hypothetical protein